MQTGKNSSVWMLLRSMSPSSASLAVSFMLTVGIIGGHLFLLSNDQSNLLLPTLAGTTNDQLAEVYSTTIQSRLDNAFENSVLGILSTALVWGVVGWVVYTIADFLGSNIRDIQASDSNISTPDRNRVVNHPLKNQLIIRLLWKFAVGFVIVVMTMALYPYISELFKQDIALLRATDPVDMLRYLGTSLGGWMMIFHLYVVLFRLFVLRTRVLGEILY